MTGIRKKFDTQLYNECDSPAKKAVQALFEQHGFGSFDIVENPKKRGVDLLVYKKGEHLFNIETEIKRVWKGDKFPYDNVQFPERKQKFAELDKPTIFVMFNEDLSSYLAVVDEDLLSSPTEMVRNRFVSYGENFFQVPLDRVYFDGLKKAIKQLEV